MLVSAIMPVRNRRHLTSLALDCFQKQTWEEKELIILDDGEEDLADLFTEIPGVTYTRTEHKQTIGAKRNALCQVANGEVIIHFDSDDWSHPDRMTQQVEKLVASGRWVIGYNPALFYDVQTGKAYRFEAGRREYALGTSLCYLKSFWKRCPFPDKQIGEDNEFVRSARRFRHTGMLDPVLVLDGEQMIVARIHADQTSRKAIGHSEFHPVPLSALPAEFLSCSA